MESIARPDDRYALAGVDRTVTILSVFDGASPLSLVEIARAAKLSDATTLRYVSSLAAHGLIERDDETCRYQLGLALFQLGQRALRGRDPRKIALPVMKELLEEFEETVNLAQRFRDELILVEALESTRSIRKGAVVGERDCWHTSALGKSLLAAMTPEEVRDLLGRQLLPRLTERTLTTVDDLLEHLQVVRRLGYAVDNEESEEGLRCVAAAVRDRYGVPRFALSVSGPTNRIKAKRIAAAGEAVAEAAARISAAFGYDSEV